MRMGTCAMAEKLVRPATCGHGHLCRHSEMNKSVIQEWKWGKQMVCYDMHCEQKQHVHALRNARTRYDMGGP